MFLYFFFWDRNCFFLNKIRREYYLENLKFFIKYDVLLRVFVYGNVLRNGFVKICIFEIDVVGKLYVLVLFCMNGKD